MADTQTVGYGPWAVGKWLQDNGGAGAAPPPGLPPNFWQTFDPSNQSSMQQLFTALQSSGALQPYQQQFQQGYAPNGATQTGTGFGDTLTTPAAPPSSLMDTLGPWLTALGPFAAGAAGVGGLEAGAGGAFDMGGTAGALGAGASGAAPGAGALAGGATGAFDMGASEGVFGSSGQPLYNSAAGAGSGFGATGLGAALPVAGAATSLLGGANGSALGTLASLFGIGAGANALLSQPAGGPGGTTGAINTVQPNDLSAYYKLLGIDPSAMVQSGQQAGGQYAQFAQLLQQLQAQMQQQAGVATGAQGDLLAAGKQAFTTAQDPQQALQDRTQQRIVDASRAGTSARGLGMSPEGAGIENQAVSNFNIDWNNQQLQRLLAGLSGMGTAYGQAGQQGQLVGADLTGAANFGSQVPGATLSSGAVPFQTQQTAYGAPIQAGNQYSTGLNTAFNPSLATYNAGQSAAGTQALLTGVNGLSQNYNQPGSWLQNVFGTGGGSSTPAGSYNPTPTLQAGY